ncbi:MAG TPA: ABC transporter ATP-binding protein [Candidatus Limnocylindria bacterium]|nr:ABC transporter ATP-binding protein [Candidatus Limnocylindria bacterium]
MLWDVAMQPLPQSLARSTPSATPVPAAGDGPPVMEMEGVWRRYDDLVAVRDVSLTISEGTILGLIGPSGSGKTTIIRMLSGTLGPSEGWLKVLGQVPLRFTREARERIAYMPQLFSLYPDLTASENVNFVSALFGVPWWGRSKLIKRSLSVVDLWEARNRPARDLSGGMQRRLELACALVHNPRVLFVDEPTAGIDPMLRQSIWDELRRLRDEGATLMVTTQYVGEAVYADRVALLDRGELIGLETPDALRRSAFGGELLQIETLRAVDPEVLRDVAGVRGVRQPGPRTLIAVTDDAGTASPRIMDALRAQGIEVSEIAEYQASYDDMFTALVQRRRDERKEDGEVDDGDDGGAAPGDPGSTDAETRAS